jgi:hypothetical protein
VNIEAKINKQEFMRIQKKITQKLQPDNMTVWTPTLNTKPTKLKSYINATTDGTLISGMTTPQTLTQVTNFTLGHILKDQVTTLQQTFKNLGHQMKTLLVDTKN